MTSKETVQAFFTAFGNGDMEGVFDVFDPNTKIVAVRDESLKSGFLHGTYNGVDGVQQFISGMGSQFNTQAFAVDNVVGEGNVAFANGSFTHEIKSTGKHFTSDWALMCVVDNDKIQEYHFYEDSHNYMEAIQP